MRDFDGLDQSEYMETESRQVTDSIWERVSK